MLVGGTAAIAGSSVAAGSNHSAPKVGGTLTVLENGTYAGSWPEGFNPATDTNALANASMMDAIYGTLFEVSGRHLINDLAAGYHFSDGGRTLTIRLRPHVRFSDGTPFNAAAVVSGWKQDLAGNSPNKPPWQPGTSMTASGPTTVVVRFAAPDGAAVAQLQTSNLNWIASPSALHKLGKRFAFYPVGAGPFKVVSDVTSNKLVLTRNRRYWEAGHPYLSKLIFLDVANDEAALEALQSGTGQAYEYMSTPTLVSGFRKAGLTVTTDASPAGNDVELNTLKPPFNNLKARAAIYYAIDAKVIDRKVEDGTCPVTESFSGPGSRFYEPRVPGYRTYDLAKAKALVKSLGGLSFTLMSGSLGNLPTEAEALQTMFQAAGMKVKLVIAPDLSSYIHAFFSKTWQAVPAAVGTWDPASGGASGLAFRLASKAPFSGVNNKVVDRYIADGAAVTSTAARAKIYAKLARYLNDRAFTPFICSGESWDIAAKGVKGPGLTTSGPTFTAGALVSWQDVSVGN